MPPYIPGLQESQILDSSKHPTEAVDVTRAGIQDRAMQRFGEGVTDLGAGLAEYASKRRILAKQIDVDNLEADARMKALEIQDKAVKTAAADGSNINQIFNDEYDSWYKERLDQVQDPDAKREGRAKVIKVRNVVNEDLYKKSQALFVEDGVRQYRRMRDQTTAGIYSNPDDYGVYVENGIKNLNRVAPLLGPENLQKEFQAYRLEVASSHIDGLTAAGRYDDARKALFEKWTGEFDDKTRKEKIDYIDQKQISTESHNQSKIRFDREDAKYKLEQLSTQNFRSLWDKQQAGANIDDEAARLEGLGMISNAHRTILTTRQDKLETRTSGYSRANFYGRAIIKGENPNALLPEVAKAVQAGDMTPSDGYQTMDFLYQLQKKREDKKFTDPAFKRLESDYRRRIGSFYGVDIDSNPIFDKLMGNNGGDRDLANASLLDFTKLVYLQGYETPEKMEQAFNITLKGKAGSVKNSNDVPNIPGLERSGYSNPKSVDDAQKRAEKDYGEKKINKDEYLKRLKLFKQLRDVNDKQAQAKGASNLVDYFRGKE